MRIDGIAALQQAATNYRTHGAARVVACFHGVVALGMSGGAAFVLLPRGLSAEGGPEVGYGVGRHTLLAHTYEMFCWP